MKLSKNQQAIITAMTAGAELILSKRCFDYGTYYMEVEFSRTKVNTKTVDSLYRNRIIVVGEVSNLEARFILAL
jgi:hypothetical protein